MIVKQYTVLSLFSGCGGLDLGFCGNFKYLNKHYNSLNYFQLAEIDNSRDGKLSMEIGSARERIITALLIYKLPTYNKYKHAKCK